MNNTIIINSVNRLKAAHNVQKTEIELVTHLDETIGIV